MYNRVINWSKRGFGSAQILRPKSVENRQLFINGKYVDSKSGKKLSVVNPATKEEICQISEAGTDDVDDALKAARNAFDNGPWKRYTAKDRSRILYKLADLVERDFDILCGLETLDNGKPLSHSKGDIQMVIDYFRYMSAIARNIYGDTIAADGPFDVKTIKELNGIYSIYIY